MDWFWYNVNQQFVAPFLDRVNYVFDDPAPTTARRLSACPECENITETTACDDPRLSVTGGLDVMLVLSKGLTGYRIIPSFIPVPSFLCTACSTRMALLLDRVFDEVCTEFKRRPRRGSPAGRRMLPECVFATRLFQCAAFNASWMVPWIIAFVVIAIASCIMTFGLC